MLSPSYLLHATEPAEEIAEKLHTDIMNRIIERIRIRFERGDDYILTAVDKWQIETLQQAGFLLDDIQKEIAAATGYMQSEIKEAMEDAGVRALEYDDRIYRDAGLDPVPLVQSPYLIDIMQRDFEATLGEWKNFTRTTAGAVEQAFIKACDDAYHMAMSGLISPSQAVREALEKIIDGGVYVNYPSGHRDTIETATARAVRTGISQASAHIQTARMDEFDVDLVLVSSHLGARPSHQEWQGKIYSRSGADPKYPDFVSSTGYGTGPGLCGWNCRHNFSPYFDGMSNPFEQYDSEENLEQYELEQRQRELERRIRKTKREVMNWKTAGDEEMYQRKSALLQKQNATYNQFCEDNGLKKRTDRINIARWDRKQAAQARAAAKNKTIDTPIKQNNKIANGLIDVTGLYKENAKPGTGSIIFSEWYDRNSHKNEVKVARIIHQEFGGDIKLLTESSVEGEKMPDYIWNDKLWELKSTSTEKAVDSAIRKGLKQIAKNPGGIVLDFSENEINLKDAQKFISDRMGRRDDVPADIMIIQKGKIIKIVRYKK